MNKHTTIAILMAPFLALGGYILADIYSKNNEETDTDKKLVITNECRPVDNQCEILGVGMEMRLRFESVPSYQRLLPIELISETSLDDVALSLVIAGNELAPVKMQDTGGKKRWTIEVLPDSTPSASNIRVRLAVSYKAALHLADFPIIY